MSRRKPSGPKPYASIGDSYVDAACVALTRTCQITAAVMAPYPKTREATLPMLFPDDVRAKLCAAQGLCEPTQSYGSYDIIPHIPGAKLSISFIGSIPTPTRAAFKPDPERAAPLLTWVRQVNAIYEQFEEVKALLRWLNRNATLGAIRYYFPTAMKLCPHSPLSDMQSVPTRFVEPRDIGNRVQMIKDAAACVTSSLLLPYDAVPVPRKDMWLTFNQYVVRPHGFDASFTTDVVTFNL